MATCQSAGIGGNPYAIYLNMVIKPDRWMFFRHQRVDDIMLTCITNKEDEN